MNPVYLAGTCDTKQAELAFVQARMTQLGVPVVLVDLSTQQPDTGHADVSARSVAACHPQGEQAVFTGDRGSSGVAMAQAFAAYITRQRDVGGLLGLGGSGGTALITPAMRALPIGVPKLMVSTMASGNVAPYVGSSDIAMVYSVTDVAGLNRVSRQVLSNAASAVAGMVRDRLPPSADDRPALGLTMFGVTTPCVQGLTDALQETYDCLVFHATGTGGMSMEKLIDNGLIVAALDITTTEIADLLFGGVLACSPDRLESVIRTQIPYLGSVGALDMVNFAARDTVPPHLADRNFYVHNDNVTLMRTTPDENVRMGRWLAERLNRMNGPVRFLLPEGGVSMLDAPAMPFYDPEADHALFDTLEREVRQTEQRRLIRVPGNINGAEFGAAALAHFRELLP